MANVTRNLTDTVSLLDVFTSRNRNVYLSLADTVVLSDILSSIYTLRFIKNIEDTIAILDVFNSIKNHLQFKNLEDTVVLSDIFNSIKRIAPILSLADTVTLLDIITTLQSDRFSHTVNDIVTLLDTFVKTQSEHFNPNSADIITLNDEVNIQFGIIVIQGTGDGSYNLGAEVQLGITPPENKVFFNWHFTKAGISNLYDPNAILTMPYGGGIITANYIDLLEGKDTIVIVDHSDFEYIDNGNDNDEILTNVTTKSVSTKMGIAQNNIEIPQGSLFDQTIVYKNNDGEPVDLTGYTAEMQIRSYKASTDDPLLTMNTSNGYIVLGGEAGTIALNIPGGITATLDFNWARYDLELYPGGVVGNSIRLLEGKVHLNKEVTR